MEELKKTIKDKRKIADSTMSSYMQILKRLIKLNGDNFIPDTTKINEDKLKKAIMNITITSRKNLLTVLIVVLGAYEKSPEP